jgi:hypothetical protein
MDASVRNARIPMPSESPMESAVANQDSLDSERKLFASLTDAKIPMPSRTPRLETATLARLDLENTELAQFVSQFFVRIQT